MLSCLKSALRQLVVGLAGRADDHKLDLAIGENLIKRVVDLDSFSSLFTESSCKLSSWAGRLALKHCSQLEVLRQRENKRRMESETRETNSEDSGLDGLERHVCGVLLGL